MVISNICLYIVGLDIMTKKCPAIFCVCLQIAQQFFWMPRWDEICLVSLDNYIMCDMMYIYIYTYVVFNVMDN